MAVQIKEMLRMLFAPSKASRNLSKKAARADGVAVFVMACVIGGFIGIAGVLCWKSSLIPLVASAATMMAIIGTVLFIVVTELSCAFLNIRKEKEKATALMGYAFAPMMLIIPVMLLLILVLMSLAYNIPASNPFVNIPTFHPFVIMSALATLVLLIIWTVLLNARAICSASPKARFGAAAGFFTLASFIGVILGFGLVIAMALGSLV